MIHTILKTYPIILLNFLSLVLPCQFNFLLAQNKSSHDLIPSLVNKFQYEIGEIRFIGNYSFSNSEIINLLASRQTNRGIDHKILLYYDVNLKYPYAKKIIPQIMINSFDQALLTMINEVQFFEQSKAENDVISIQDFYNQNGFHKAKVSYTFEADIKRQINILSFYINEDSASIISGITYQGLDSLPM
ncbi:MAG: hypothetical protein M1419_05165, partial [Bacteroidetes bacterium]|nr:hypothetical protein [Bacteroidota bacterium]